MKKILFATALMSLFFVSRAQDSKEQADIKFEVTEHDFGNIKEGTIATYDFKFTNSGKEPLVLSNAQPSCGCTTPEWPREPIAPGVTSKVRAVYNSTNRPGNFDKLITVKSNAKSGDIVLKIRGVVEPIPVEPKSPVRNPTLE